MKLCLVVVAALVVCSAAVRPALSPVPTNDWLGCKLCKVTFSTLEQLLSSNATESFIEWALGEICELMPEPEKTACHTVVNTDVEELIKMLKQVESPAEICCQLGACDEPCPVVDPGCEVCKFLMDDIERWIEEGKGKEEIEKLLDAWCLLLPSSAQATCKKITDTGLDIIIDMIIKYENPQIVCEQITLCNATAASMIANSKGKHHQSNVFGKIAALAKADPSAGCVWCKIGFGMLEELVSMNATETAIEWALGQLCNLLPDPQKTACHSVVLTDIKELIEMVKSVESPEEICCQVGACDDPCPVVDVPCAICKFLLNDIDRWLREGKGKAEIEHLIDQWCTLLPSGTDICQVITDIGLEALLDIMLKYENPSLACYELTLCNTTSISH